MILFTGGLNYKSPTFAVLFPTYNNCSGQCMVRLLVLFFDRAVRFTYSNKLHVVLNSEIANIVLIIRADVQIKMNCPIS